MAREMEKTQRLLFLWLRHSHLSTKKIGSHEELIFRVLVGYGFCD